jgi:hypothetical protein
MSRSLFQAVKSGKLDEVKAALAGGANVNDKDDDGETALNRAADEGHFEIVKFLVENGADLNNKGTNDKTPLMYAIYSREPKESHNAIIPYLVEKRADVSNDLMMRVKIKVDILKENSELGMVLPEAAQAWERLFSYLKVARARQDFALLVLGLSNQESDVRRDAADYALATLFTFDDMDISEAVPALQKLLGDADEQTRRYAASCLCIHFTGRKDAAALKELFGQPRRCHTGAGRLRRDPADPAPSGRVGRSNHHRGPGERRKQARPRTGEPGAVDARRVRTMACSTCGSTSRLRFPNEKLEGQGQLHQCPQCGAYSLEGRPASMFEAAAFLHRNPEFHDGLEIEAKSFKAKAEAIVREAIDRISHERLAALILAEYLPSVRDPRPLFGRVASLLEIESVRETIQSALLKTFDRWAGDVNAINEILDDILKQNPGAPKVAQFVDTMRQANKTIMDEAYRKIIRNLTHSYLTDGTAARCPKCRSTNVAPGEGWMEFTRMKCNACGNEELADDYQLEDWYPES